MEKKRNHITRGDVLDDLGFSKSQASALKIKADIMGPIIDEIRRKGYTQAQLTEILDEYQPNVSNLMRGRVSKISIEKLLTYSDRLQMKSAIEIKPSRRHVQVA